VLYARSALLKRGVKTMIAKHCTGCKHSLCCLTDDSFEMLNIAQCQRCKQIHVVVVMFNETTGESYLGGHILEDKYVKHCSLLRERWRDCRYKNATCWVCENE